MSVRPVKIDAASARRRFLVLRGARWLPTGLLIPVLVLYLLERGLTLTQIGIVSAAQGVMVMVLELPTGGLADALGRRRVLLVANLFDIVTLSLFIVGDSMGWFLAAWAVQGVFRALESGPLDAWFVDALHDAGATGQVERGLGLGGVVLGVALATGSAISGGLVWVGGRIDGIDALALPFMVALGLRILDTLLVRRLMVELRPPAGLAMLRASVRAVPGIVRSSISLVITSSTLLLLVLVEVTWGFGMVAFETLFPPLLADQMSSPDRAAAVLGPVSAAAWLASAGGAAVVSGFSARVGRHRAAAMMRVLQAGTLVAMGAAAGPIGAITGYLACYALHGAANPVHQTLLHERARADNRATVLSLNSLMASGAGAVGGIVLGAVADGTSIAIGMYVGAVVMAIGAPLYVLADRSGRRVACRS